MAKWLTPTSRTQPAPSWSARRPFPGWPPAYPRAKQTLANASARPWRLLPMRCGVNAAPHRGVVEDTRGPSRSSRAQRGVIPSSLPDSLAPNAFVADCEGLLGGYHEPECTDKVWRVQRIFPPNGCRSASRTDPGSRCLLEMLRLPPRSIPRHCNRTFLFCYIMHDATSL
jgi:hypothetical protein